MSQRNNQTGEGVPPQAELKWIDTTGGPHVLLPEEGLDDWKGVENWTDNSESDPSDYARACRNGANWLNPIRSARYDASVFGGDVGPIAWLPKSDSSGIFVQWLGCDDDATLFNLLAQDELGAIKRLKYEDNFLLETGPSGRMVLLDASGIGLDIGEDDREIVSLLPGQYRMSAYYLETDACTIVVRTLSRHDHR
jgi:hypothetical protein